MLVKHWLSSSLYNVMAGSIDFFFFKKKPYYMTSFKSGQDEPHPVL